METMVQPKITGYRQLNEAEVALMNEGKELAARVGAFVARLRSEPSGAPLSQQAIPDQRWISIGATQIQQGFMALGRGIARPEGF